MLSGVGCAPAGSRLEITSYKDPYFPERFTLALDQCGYRTDLRGDYHVAGFVSAALDQPDEIVDQYVTLQIYWRPRPGKTGDHASLNDAVIRYAIVTPRGAAVYKGTAYAYPRRSGGDQRVRFELENARLRLEHAVGDAPEILGQARITGAIDARLDPARAVRYANEVSRLAALPRWPDPPQP